MDERDAIPMHIASFPKSLHRHVKILAAETDRTIKDIVVEAVQEKIARIEAGQESPL